MKRQKGIIIGSILFIVLLVIDLATTLKLGKLSGYLEANPLYPYIGFSGIVLINIILIAVVYWLYRRSDNVDARFFYMNSLVTFCIIRILIVVNNIRVGLNPPTIQQAQQVTTAMKVATVNKFFWIAYIPFFIGIISYILYKIDHKIEVKE